MAILFKFTSLVLVLSCFNASTSDEMVRVSQATLEKAVDMMEAGDDWMNSLKLMMNNGTTRFKMETRRILEFGDEVTEDETPLLTSTAIDEAIPMPKPISRLVTRRIEEFEPTVAQNIRSSDIVMGDVGVCKTDFKVETVTTALLRRKPHLSKVHLAHPVPIAVGSCKRPFPLTDGNGRHRGKCVLSSQYHITWILVPQEDWKEYTDCQDIPGVTSLKKCADWIIIGGRCVFDKFWS